MKTDRRVLYDVVEGYALYRYEGEYDSEGLDDSNFNVNNCPIVDNDSSDKVLVQKSRSGSGVTRMIYEHPLIFIYLWGLLVFCLGFYLGRPV